MNSDFDNKSYRTVLFECSGEITEKKSRFIATVVPVSSEEEAIEFIAEMKKKYWDARHNCSAYIIAGNGENEKDIEKCSDDGEPSRTAGMPMLDILKAEGLKNVAAVVTRYFGGVLLGTGGLVRAYQGAMKAGLGAAHMAVCRLLNRCRIETDYNGYGKLAFLTERDKMITENTVFTDNVTAIVLCDDMQYGKLASEMTEATAGKCRIEIIERVYKNVPEQ